MHGVTEYNRIICCVCNIHSFGRLQFNYGRVIIISVYQSQNNGKLISNINCNGVHVYTHEINSNIPKLFVDALIDLYKRCTNDLKCLSIFIYTYIYIYT